MAVAQGQKGERHRAVSAKNIDTGNLNCAVKNRIIVGANFNHKENAQCDLIGSYLLYNQ